MFCCTSHATLGGVHAGGDHIKSAVLFDDFSLFFSCLCGFLLFLGHPTASLIPALLNSRHSRVPMWFEELADVSDIVLIACMRRTPFTRMRKAPAVFFFARAHWRNIRWIPRGVTKRHPKTNHTAPKSQPSRTFSRTSVKDFCEGFL